MLPRMLFLILVNQRNILRVYQSSQRVGNLTWGQSLPVAQLSSFIHIRLVLFYLVLHVLHREVPQVILLFLVPILLRDHHPMDLVDDFSVWVLLAQDDNQQKLVISANRMHQRKILKRRNDEQNISSPLFLIQKKISISFAEQRVLLVKNKKKILMISSKHSLIDLVKKWKLETF